MTIALDARPTTTKVVLVRHGETDWNVARRYQGTSDVPLNETGRRQARLVAKAIGQDGWDVIISSPLSRAMDTARVIADVAGIDRNEIIPDPDVQERGYGAAEGLTLAEREARWPDGEWPGLEDWDNVAIRGRCAIERAVAGHPGRRVMIVCHGGLINAILAQLSHNAVGTGKSVILNTSRTELTHDHDEWTIGEISVADHLDDMAAD